MLCPVLSPRYCSHGTLQIALQVPQARLQQQVSQQQVQQAVQQMQKTAPFSLQQAVEKDQYKLQSAQVIAIGSGESCDFVCPLPLVFSLRLFVFSESRGSG